MEKIKDLNKLTYEELKKELNQIEIKKEEIKNKSMEYCIIRTYSAGVFVGLIDRNIKGKENTIYNSRRIWYWNGANSLSQLANEGSKKPDDCKLAQEVNQTDLKEIIEIIVCTDKAKDNIQSIKIWEQ